MGANMPVNFWAFVWWLSETSGIGLGRFAPFVFERMIGGKGKRVVKGASVDEQAGAPICECGHAKDIHFRYTNLPHLDAIGFCNHSKCGCGSYRPPSGRR